MVVCTYAKLSINLRIQLYPETKNTYRAAFVYKAFRQSNKT